VNNKTYSIFGAGGAGLYTGWRLLNGKAKSAKGKAKLLSPGDTLELYDWGKYDFSKKHPGTREPGARVCTWHYQDNKEKSYLELGGMRYAEYDEQNGGHLLVTTVIKRLGLDKYSRILMNQSTNCSFCATATCSFLKFPRAIPHPITSRAVAQAKVLTTDSTKSALWR